MKLKLTTTRHGQAPRPEGWEMLDQITDEEGKAVASVVYRPWSDPSCEEADRILTEQLTRAGYGWEEVEQP